MGNGSALVGHKPNTRNDALIRKGLLLIAPSEINPVPGQPFGPPRPTNYVFETWSPSMQGGVGVAMFMVSAFTISRLAARAFYARRLGLDDLVIIPGALGCLAYLTNIIVQTKVGCLGDHMFDCTYERVNGYFEWAQVNYPLFFFAVFTIKLSIALQNRRMTLMASRRWQITHWVFIVLFLILIPLMTIINMIRCVPLGAGYNLITLASIPDPAGNITCLLNATILSYASRVVHVVTDIALLSVPVIIVSRLHMPRRKKLRLISIFAVGGLSTIASIVRCTRLGSETGDITWETRLVYAFNTIDVTTAAVVANMPALNILVDVTLEKLKSFSKSIISLRTIRLPRSTRRHSSTDDQGLAIERADARAMRAPAVSMYITTTGALGTTEIESIGKNDCIGSQMA